MLVSKRDYMKAKLNEHQRFLLEVIEKRNRISSGELFDLYQKSFTQPLGERAYRNQLEHLVQAGLVKDIGEGRWRNYVTEVSQELHRESYLLALYVSHGNYRD